jgi:choline-sulfatase
MSGTRAGLPAVVSESRSGMSRRVSRSSVKAPRGAASPKPAGRRLGRQRAAAVCAAVALGVGLAALVWRAGKPGTEPPPRPVSVVLIIIDTLRADALGCYGNRQAATPVLDALAARGARFPNAIAHVPLTLPSHASILTGVTPLVHGVRNNTDFVLGPAPPTVAERFRAAGYETAAFVSGFPVHRRFGLGRGFDSYDDRFPRGSDPARLPYVDRRGDATVAAALAWLDRASADRSKPFFVWLHLFDPHAPYAPPEPFLSRFRDRPYDGEVAFADAQVGVFLDGVARARPNDPIIVLATSDHGESLGEHGEPTHGLFVYDSTTRVPLILAGPGVPAGRVLQTLARGIDVAPTLLEAAHLPPLTGAEGRSLLAAVTSPAATRDEPAYIESLYARLSFGWAPLYGWRDRDWLYVDAPEPELYDLNRDGAQARNLATDRPSEAARFRRAVDAAVANGRPAEPVAAGRDTAERLRSLGYTSGGAIKNPSLRDPKAFIALAVRIENAIAKEQTDAAGAAAEFRAVLKDDPANPVARRHLAIALSTARRFDEAIAEYRRLVADGIATRESFIGLTDCYRLSGRLEDALDTGRMAAERDPSTPDGLDAVGKTLVALGRRDEARGAFERALAIQSDDPDALAGLADLAIERAEFPEAQQRLEALAARDPDDTDTTLKLGVVLVRTSQLDRAIALFTAVVSRQPAHKEALINLAGALAKAGRAAEAVPFFERAVQAGAVTPIVLNGLGFARIESGNTRGGIEALRRSLRLKPDQPNIVAALAQIEGRGR